MKERKKYREIERRGTIEDNSENHIAIRLLPSEENDFIWIRLFNFKM